MSPPAIGFRVAAVGEIELIRPLWIQLNAYHHAHAGTFRGHYERMTFDDRKAHFQKIAENGRLRIDLAYDTSAGQYVGFCVSSLSAENYGEIESVFVGEAYRSRGTGSELLRRALLWLGENGSVRNRVSVADGNEAAFGFYRKFGFFPRMTVLEQTREP